jgi:hypothetical protein
MDFRHVFTPPLYLLDQGCLPALISFIASSTLSFPILPPTF